MNKRDYFMQCMREGMFRDKRWCIRAFSLVRESKTAEELKPLEILQTAAGFLVKTLDNQMVTLDAKPGQPIYTAQETLEVNPGELPGIEKKETTTYGRILYHAIVFVWPFKGKIKFKNEVVNLSQFEDTIAEKLIDDPAEGEVDPKASADTIYCKELVAYYEAVAYTRGLAMLFVPAASPKAMTIDPAVLKRRDELFNDPKIDMNDQAVAASVEKELTEMDKKSFEGDVASGFLINKKDFGVVRKKRFISFGSAPGMTPDSKTNYVKRSLNEGIDVKQFPDYANEMRTGSYKRGVETMFGGELDKWLVRQSSNMRVVPDCGTTIGLPVKITEYNMRHMLDKHIVDGKGYVTLTEENVGTYLGKTVLKRSPFACKAAAPDYCEVCLGKKLSMNPDALSIAFSQYGHDFMGESMSAMHGKVLQTARMDLISEAS